MSNNEKYASEILAGFQNNKGKASAYCIKPNNPAYTIANAIIKFTNKHPDDEILIIADSYYVRKDIQNALEAINGVNIEYNYKVLTYNYINMDKYHYSSKFTIITGINCNTSEEYNSIIKLANESTFTLCLFTEFIYCKEYIINIRKILPNIFTSVNSEDFVKDLIYSPVEEYLVGVDINDEDRENYNKYTQFINQSIKIFGDLTAIEKCKRGDDRLGISATEFRHTLAESNGWSPELDTSIEFNKLIDEVYNPNLLFERACTFYNISAQRRNLLTDNIAKINEILNICEDNKDKRIIIVSKRGEFAAKITKYINENSDLKCVDYHDEIEDAIMVDDMGFPVLHKSGANKGKPRIIKAQAISTQNLAKFNKGISSILSIKQSSNVKIETNADIVIITDGINEDITEFKSRYRHITYNTNPLIVYRLYCNNSIEYRKLSECNSPKNVTLIWLNEKNVSFDEKSGDIIL